MAYVLENLSQVSTSTNTACGCRMFNICSLGRRILLAFSTFYPFVVVWLVAVNPKLHCHKMAPQIQPKLDILYSH